MTRETQGACTVIVRDLVFPSLKILEISVCYTAMADGPWWNTGFDGPGKLRGRIEYLPVEWHTKFREKAGEGEEVR